MVDTLLLVMVVTNCVCVIYIYIYIYIYIIHRGHTRGARCIAGLFRLLVQLERPSIVESDGRPTREA